MNEGGSRMIRLPDAEVDSATFDTLRPPRSSRAERGAGSRPLTSLEWYRLVDEFSHDVRTPLCVASEYSRLLRDDCCGPVDDEQREFLDTVIDREEEIHFLVEALLTTARLEADAAAPRCEPFPALELFQDVAAHLTRIAATREATFRASMPLEAIPVRSDRRLMELVLLALGRFCLRRCDGVRPVTLRVACSRPVGEVLIRFAYRGRSPRPQHLAGLRDQLRAAKADDCGALDIELGLAHEVVRELGARLTVRRSMGHVALCVRLRFDQNAGEANRSC